MSERDPRLLLFHAPLLRQDMTTPKVMRDVIIALLPATAAGLWYFGLAAGLIIVASIAGAVLAEWMFSPSDRRGRTLLDNSGVLTGLLLGLTLPPGAASATTCSTPRCSVVRSCWPRSRLR